MQKIWKKKKVLIPLIVVVIVFMTMFFYVNDYYHSDYSIEEYLNGSSLVDIIEIEDGLFLDGPGGDTAMIFYPGAKVEYTAYLPMLSKLAVEGIDCFLINMPLNLAFLGQNKAEEIIQSYSLMNKEASSREVVDGNVNDYKHWYISGHSLGGAMAASYASKNLEELDGLILFAAYPTKSLKSENFLVMSILGSEDGVLNMEKLKAGREFMPDNYIEVCIEGGNHAYFGNYAKQKGDNDALISQEEQQEQAIEEILKIL